MQILRVELEGFRSFTRRQSFDLNRGHGLFLMRGQNEVDSDLGANGVGKSTFWDAIRWCLYGATARKLKGPKVESWKNTATDVRVTLQIDGATHTVRRTRNPIKLQLNDKLIGQAALTELLGISDILWDQVFMQGQFGRYFFDLASSDRLLALSDLLDLNQWSDAAKSAAKRSREIGKELDEHKRKISRVEGLLEADEDVLRGQEEQTARRLEDLEACDEEQHTHQQQLKEGMREEEAKIRDLDELIAEKTRDGELGVAIEKSREANQQHERRYGAMVERRGSLRTEVQHHAKRMQRLNKMENVCVLCEQKVSSDHQHDMVDEAERDLQKAEESLNRVQADIRKHDKKTAELRDELNALLKEQTEAQRIVSRAEREKAQCQSQWTMYEQKIDAAAQVRKRLEDEVRESDVAEGVARQRVADRRAVLVDLDQESHGIVALIDLTAQWAEHFRQIRMFVVDRALVQLRSAVNSSLTELGLRGWKVSFQVGAHQTTGAVTKGFEVMVQSPQSPEKVPWEAWSGGETQRLRIAGAIGMASLIANRLGVQTHMEIWDEPTAHLDEVGVADLISYMEDRARGNRAIWLVDHRSLSRGAFKGTALVTKTSEGSKIQYTE